MQILKYPRTRHLESSGIQKDDLNDHVPFSEIAGKYLVVEEKLDGANCAVSFTASGELVLQSRGHALVGGPRERHWDLFKSWASFHEALLLDVLTDRYVMYGEFCYAKHTVFYDLLPHYFIEFDVFDRSRGCFLSTQERYALLPSPQIVSAKVIAARQFETLDELVSLVTRSFFKSGLWRDELVSAARDASVEPDLAMRQTDISESMEGLYIKVESALTVDDRLKFVRSDFMQAIIDSDHWLTRPIIKNKLSPFVDMFK